MAGTMLSAWRSSAVLAGVVLVGAALIDAQPTQDDEDYPHAYPRPGVEKRFENERVIIWEVVWLDGVPMPYHRHRYDMTGVFLRWGPLRVTRPDGTFTVSEEPFDIPSVFLLRKGVTHKEEGIGTPERHSIMIDLKDYHPPRRDLRTDIPPAFPRDGSSMMLDEDRVTVWNVKLESGQEVPLHVHNRDTVAVFLEGGTIRSVHEDGTEATTTYAHKDVRYWSAVLVGGTRAPGGRGRRLTARDALRATGLAGQQGGLRGTTSG